MPFHSDELLEQRKKLFSVIVTDLDFMIDTELSDATAGKLKHKLIVNLLNIVRIIKGIKYDSATQNIKYYVDRAIEVVDNANRAVNDATILEYSTTSTDLLDIKQDLYEILEG